MTAANRAVDLFVFHQEALKGHQSQSGFSSTESILLQPRSHPFWTNLRKINRAPANTFRKRFRVYAINPCKSLLVNSLPCKQSLWEGETPVPALSAAVARLTCGQQRERLTQVSKARGHPGFSPQPAHFHSADSLGLLAMCAAATLITLQEHRLTEIYSFPLTPLPLVLSGNLTLQQKVFCTWSAQALMINGENG